MWPGERTTLRSVVQFRLLGVVEARRHRTVADLGGQRERRVLTALLAARGQFVCRPELIDWVWDHPPRDTEAALDDIVEVLRTERLRPIGLADSLTCDNGLYRLDVPPEWVDVHQFRVLAERAAQLDDDDGREFLTAALHSVRGIPLADLVGQRIDEYRRELCAELRAIEVRFARIELERGRAPELLPRLERLFRQYPGEAAVAEIYLSALHDAGLAPATVAARTRIARRARESWAQHMSAASAL